MTREEIKSALLGIINDILPDEELSDLKDDLPLRNQLGLDSVDFLDVILLLKKNLKVEVPPEDFEKLSTINSSIQYIESKLSHEGR